MLIKPQICAGNQMALDVINVTNGMEVTKESHLLCLSNNRCFKYVTFFKLDLGLLSGERIGYAPPPHPPNYRR